MEGNRNDWTVPAQLRRRAEERPQDIAHRLVDGDDLTFGRWDAASNAAACGLLARGVHPGERVLLPCSTAAWTAYAVAWAAVLKAGAVAVPVSRTAGRAAMWATWAASGAVCVVDGDAEVLPEAEHVTLDELIAAGDPAAIAAGPGPQDDAEIIFTSGTTGVPKGVVATHENVLHPLRDPRPGAVRTALHSLPPGTTVGQGLLVQPLSARPHRTFTLPAFTPDGLLSAVERLRPTDVVLVPAMAIALLDAAGTHTYDLSSVLQVRTTSAPIHPATLQGLARRFPSARIRNVYSTTECWPRRLATDFDRARPTSLGRPTVAGQVRIVTTAGTEAPPGVAGDVQLRSDAPQRRYDGEEGPSGVFLPGGWTRTGDVGRLDADGYFYLVDRNPDLVNTGGLNVSTLDVEAAIMEYPGIVEAAVCGVPHPVLTECVVAAVTARPGLDVPALLEFLRDRKGAAAPQRITVLDELPHNFLGKIDKKRLRAELAAEPAAAAAEPPSTPTEVALAEIWAVTLDLDEVAATDDFLRIGGSS
ncbi:MAG TPA: class I adenylate-forming enzyme family protein, partial [Mycobacteriales bacterium]|nr:class I adenylate-forming enzyme family protein [Mycobacteriales bacterium]